MKSILIIFLFYLYCFTSQNCIPYSSYKCTDCTQGLYYGTTEACIGVCPTGFTLSSTICSIQSSPYLLFSTDFTKPVNLTNSSIGWFTTNLGTTFNTLGNPFQTKERGFYFPENSIVTVNTSYTPAPDLTLLIWIRPLKIGTIFSITGNSIYLSLTNWNTSADFLLQLRLCYYLNICGLVSGLPYSIAQSTRLTANNPNWRYIRLTTQVIDLSTMQFTFNIDYTYIDSGTLSSINTIGLSNEAFIWKLGDSVAGFSGFIYRIDCYNGIYNGNLPFIYPPICNPYYYFEEGLCLPCGNACPTTGPWCVRGSDCSYCYTNLCTSCTGYAPSLCTVISGTCPGGCYDCASSTACNKCDPDSMIIAYLTEGTYCFNLADFPLRSNIFYDWMITGSVTPVPYPCRGYYFDGKANYFEARRTPVFPTNLLVYMWVNPYSGIIISKGHILTIYSSLNAEITLMDSYSNIATINTSLSMTSNGWHYAAYQLTYTNFITTLIIYVSNTKYSLTSIFGYYFQDNSANSFGIGFSGTLYFNGFIAGIGIAATNANPTYVIGYNESIAFYCGMLNDYNTYNNLLNITGLSQTNDACEDFSKKSFYSCPYGTNYIYTSPSNLTKNGESLIGNSYYPCRGTCLLCSKGLICTSCNLPYVLYGNICISQCPSGYSYNSATQACTFIGGFVFVFIPYNNITLANSSTFIFESNNINTYPIFSNNNPIPVYNRGYYFTSNSSIISNEYIIAPYFSIAVWIRFISDGDVYAKQNNWTNKMSFSHKVNFIFSINTLFDSGIINSTKAINIHSWQYIQMLCHFDTTNLCSVCHMLYNKIYTRTLFIYNDFFDDNSTNSFIIGSNNATGFTGFLYSIEVYNLNKVLSMFSTSCIGSAYCPSSTVTLGLCNITQLESSCGLCNQSCTYGCVRSTDCKLCQDPLCNACDTFNSSCNSCGANSALVNNVCVCNNGYTINNINECVPCDQTCLTCNGLTSSSCLSCHITTVYFTPLSRCVYALACPTSPTSAATPISSSNTCNLGSGMAFYADLNSISNDTINNIALTLPIITAYQPLPAIGRGYYFNSNSYLNIDPETLSKLVFGPEFCIGIWVYVITTGDIFTRNIATNDIIYIYANNTAALGISFNIKLISYDNKFTTAIASTFTLNTWNLFEARCGTADLGNAFLTAINQASQGTASMSYFQDSIRNANTILGDGHGNTGFVGFIWSIKVYNIWTSLTVNTSPTANCYYPIELSTCLSACLINQFPPNCTDCFSGCINGCIQYPSCSLCSDPLCSICFNYTSCKTCMEYAYFDSNHICQCMYTINNATGSCNPYINCYTNCKTCTDTSALACTNCINGYYFVNNFCILCPTGYTITATGDCVLNSSIAFYIKFDELGGILYDSYNNIPVITGNSGVFYPDYEFNSPWAAYLRGYYFNGASSLARLPIYNNYTTPRLILSMNWTIEIWIFPNASTGCFISSASLNGTLFSICYSADMQISLNINFTNARIQSEKSISSLLLNQWQVIRISISYSTLNTIRFYINNILVSTSIAAGSIFPNYYINTSYTIGYFSPVFFKGFIYELAFYNFFTPPSRLLEAASCVASYQGNCLPKCFINEYWIGPEYNNCSSCLDSCTYGCRNNNTCSLCVDSLCQNCANYNTSICRNCVTNAVAINNCACNQGYVLNYIDQTCIKCEANQYYYQGSCKNCSGLCINCSQTQCFSCVTNAIIKEWNCSCIIGYNGTTSCELAYFIATITGNNDNTLLIDFADPLLIDIKSTNLLINTCTETNLTFTLFKWTNQRYYIQSTYSSTIPSNCTITINFQSLYNISSIYNSILINKTLSGVLISSDVLTNNAVIANAKATSSVITVTATTTSVSIAMANPNPACLLILYKCFAIFQWVALPCHQNFKAIYKD